MLASSSSSVFPRNNNERRRTVQQQQSSVKTCRRKMGNKICVNACCRSNGSGAAADGDVEATTRLHDLGVLIGKPKFPKLATTAERLASFKDWPMEITQQMPRSLVESGFFYTGVKDVAQCFHCGLHLYDWIPTDIPWNAHARGNPKCDYLRLCKSAAFIKTINEQWENCKNADDEKFVETDNSECLVIDDSKIAELDEKTPSWRGDQYVQHLMEMCFDEKLIAAAIVTNGFSTFDNLESMLERLEKLSTARENAESQESFSVDYLPKPVTPPEKLCKICMDDEVSVVFLPCAHLVCCPTCSPALQQCPICRTEAVARIRIYSS